MEIEILTPEGLRKWCSMIEMPQEAVNELASVAEKVKQDQDLYHHFADFHEKTAMRGEWHKEWSPLDFDPLITEHFGQQASFFYLLAYMAAMPYTAKEYERLGISMDIFSSTLHDITFYTCQATDVFGYWNFERFPWVWRHLESKLFRLGRLQYMLIPYHGHATAFKNKQTGEIFLLCGPDILLRDDGYAFGAGQRDGAPDPEPQPGETWQAIYEETEEGWRGNSISPYGYTLRETVSLPKTEWDLILKKGDTVLDLHIPRAKNLTPEDVRASFRQAFDFFGQHWPDQPFKASFCHTWFFTPQLQTLLPPTSSIVNFQREFYLYPHPGGPSFLWSFVFGDKYPDPATAPRDTSLRRDVLDWLAQGKELFDLPGLMFHAPEEWGSQPYMRRWDLSHRASE